MNIETILKAAEYLERKEREAEHGYALTRYYHGPAVPRRRASTSAARLVKARGSLRSTHNELEKNRRAHLRYCMEKLKDVVPLNGDSTRHTTLGLLNDAKLLIRRLEITETQQSHLVERLKQEQHSLKVRLDQLNGCQYRVHSLSECSTTSSSSAHSSATSSEHDDVDVIGTGSSGDDADDHSSLSSDSGIAAIARNGRRFSASAITSHFGQLMSSAL